MTITVAEVLDALRRDYDPESGWVRNWLSPLDRGEVFIQERPGFTLWIREDGRYVRGWRERGIYRFRDFGLIDAWRIRRAIRNWSSRRDAATMRAFDQ